LLQLVECASRLLAVRPLLIGSLTPYDPTAISGLADVVELFSAVATEVSLLAETIRETESQAHLADEPLSFDEAINGLPGFITDVEETLRSSTDVGALTCCDWEVRAQTFAFFLREESARSPDL
jgi:hypothetical protein